jgi:hypothetical protein
MHVQNRGPKRWEVSPGVAAGVATGVGSGLAPVMAVFTGETSLPATGDIDGELSYAFVKPCGQASRLFLKATLQRDMTTGTPMAF